MYAASGLDTDSITIAIVSVIKEPNPILWLVLFSLSLQYLLTLKTLYYEKDYFIITACFSKCHRICKKELYNP